MVQFGVLNWTHLSAESGPTLDSGPALDTYTDNVRLLEGFAAQQQMSPEDAQQLSDIYRRYRAETHRLALQEQSAVVDAQLFADERAAVRQVWQQLFA